MSSGDAVLTTALIYRERGADWTGEERFDGGVESPVLLIGVICDIGWVESLMRLRVGQVGSTSGGSSRRLTVQLVCRWWLLLRAVTQRDTRALLI